MSCADFWTVLGTCVTAVATCVMAYVAWQQFPTLNKSLNDSNLMAIFEVEFELNRRKERLEDIRKENTDFVNGRKKDDFTEAELKILEKMNLRYNEALENYLNVFDRLCYFILKNKLNEEDFRTEYRDMLKKSVAEFKDYFQNNTKYRNMIKLNNIWSDK